MPLPRRAFLQSGLAGAAGILIGPPAAAALPAVPADARIDVVIDEPIGTIAPEIYGHFTENLGAVIYDGVWVGESSRVANVSGVRAALVEAMRPIKPAVIRFPGGCFADSYDWRDGVGASASRARRTNFWSDEEASIGATGHADDANAFGTGEFVRFCKLVGARPYLAANVRSLPGEAFDLWVEYCNAPAGSTTLADARANDGFREPLGVQYWGVGNEAWGCGGTFTPQEYAAEFCRYTAAVPDYGVDLRFIASGPDKGDDAWTRGFFEEIARRGKGVLASIYAFALHDYTWNLSRGKTPDWVRGKGDALRFEAVDWYELLRQGAGMEALITEHWRIMGEHDPQHAVKLAVDEWGSWYRPGSATPGDLFEQTPTMRDAVYSAMNLDIFNRNAEKIAMANCAQLINCLNSLYLAHEDKFCVTPVGHVFAMYAAHQGGRAVRTEFAAPDVSYDRDGKPAMFWRLNGSASLHGKTLVLTVVNAHASDPCRATVAVHGAALVSASATTLGGGDIHAHNTFDRPTVVTPSDRAGIPIAGALHWTFAPASVTKLTMQLA